MCPGTLAMVAVGAQAAGSLMKGISAGNAANYQGAVAANNATIERQNAAYAASAGSTQIENAGLRARAQGANIRAGFAGNNLEVNSGSPVDVQQSQKTLGQLDTETVAGNASREVYGYQAKATDFTAQSKLDKAEAIGDYIGAAVGAVGDVAGGFPDLPTAGGSGGIGPGTADALSANVLPYSGSQVSQMLEPSLISGPPSVPEEYTWMQANPGNYAGTPGP